MTCATVPLHLPISRKVKPIGFFFIQKLPFVHCRTFPMDEDGKTLSAAESYRPNPALICVVLVVLTLALYWQLRGHEFINYDDPYYITGNAEINKGFTKEGFVWAFSRLTGYGTYWHPVTWLSHMMDC